MSRLWKIDGEKLIQLSDGHLGMERNLESWIEHDPSMLDQDMLIIGRQVSTGHGEIDLLAIRSDGSLVIIELKRDKSPREAVAQLIDYASWVAKRNTADIHSIAQDYSEKKGLKSFAERFQDAFDSALSEVLNESHEMLLVASSLDSRSTRIIEYLSEEHDISINTGFFKVFTDGNHQYLSANWLLDQQEVSERSAVRTKAPWAGDWFVNVGDGPSRSWEDMRKYGFIAAGGGRFYSGRLDQLSKGDPIYAYQKGAGYVGYGIVEDESMLANDFEVNGVPLFQAKLEQPKLAHDSDNPELAEYIVPVTWKKTFPISQAKKFPGAFANQNIACRLRDQRTLDFVKNLFGD